MVAEVKGSPARGSRAATFALLALAACRAEEGELRLDLPIDDLHRAAIIAVWTPDDPARAIIYARAIRDDHTISPLALPFARERGLSVAVALYGASLDELFLSDAKIELPTGDASRAVPSTIEVLETQVTAEGTGPWRSVTSSPGLAAARLPTLEDCRSRTGTTHQLPLALDPIFAVGVHVESPPVGFTGEGALIGTERRHLFYVERDRAIELQSTIPGPCGNDPLDRAQFYGAYQEPGGTVWLAARCGELHRTSIDLVNAKLQGAVARALLDRDSAHAVAGPTERDGEVTVLHALSENGELDRISVTEGATQLVALGAKGDGGLVHLGDDEAAMVWSSTPEVLRARGAELIHEVVPIAEATTELRRIATTRDLGLVVGDSAGQLYFERSDRWRPLGAAMAGPIEAITPRGGTAAILDGSGVVREYSPTRGTFCAAESPPADAPSTKWRHLAVTNGAVIVAGNAGSYLWYEEE